MKRSLTDSGYLYINYIENINEILGKCQQKLKFTRSPDLDITQMIFRFDTYEIESSIMKTTALTASKVETN